MDTLESMLDANVTNEIESIHAWGTKNDNSLDLIGNLSWTNKNTHSKFMSHLKSPVKIGYNDIDPDTH